MKIAKQVQTNALLEVAPNVNYLAKLSNGNLLICPCCDKNVYYFAGSVKVSAHFKHKRGVSSHECELYVSGLNDTLGSLVTTHFHQRASNKSSYTRQVEIECKIIYVKIDITIVNISILLKSKKTTSVTPLKVTIQDNREHRNTLIQSDYSIRKSFIVHLPLLEKIELENCDCTSTCEYINFVNQLLQNHIVFPLKRIDTTECKFIFREKLFIDEVDAVYEITPNYQNSIIERTGENEKSLTHQLKQDGYIIENGFREEFFIHSSNLVDYSDSSYYLTTFENLKVSTQRKVILTIEMHSNCGKNSTQKIEIDGETKTNINVPSQTSTLYLSSESGEKMKLEVTTSTAKICDSYNITDEPINFLLTEKKNLIKFTRTDSLWAVTQVIFKDYKPYIEDSFLSIDNWNNLQLRNGF
jgi:hypothetical protein